MFTYKNYEICQSKVFLEWDIGVNAEYSLKTQYSLVAPRFSLTDVLSLPQSMAANGRMPPNLPRLLSVLLVSVLSQKSRYNAHDGESIYQPRLPPLLSVSFAGAKVWARASSAQARRTSSITPLDKRAFRNPLLVRALNFERKYQHSDSSERYFVPVGCDVSDAEILSDLTSITGKRLAATVTDFG